MADNIISINGIDLWYETIGDPNHSPILLMMGNSSQGILWPDEFCQQLTRHNRYIIRFDYRDTGLSSCIDYDKHPYNLFDLVNDSIGLLDALKIQKTHIVGLSMGGALAQLLAVYHKDRVLSITSIMSSPDLSIKNDAFKGKNVTNAILPAPNPAFIKGVIELNKTEPKNIQEKIQQQVGNWRLSNGNKAPFDETYWYHLIEKALSREATNPTAKNLKFANLGNHSKAQAATSEPNLDMLKKITTPTLIIHGKQDPIFPPAHAEAIANSVANAKLLLIDEMGHALNPIYFNEIVSAIINHTRE